MSQKYKTGLSCPNFEGKKEIPSPRNFLWRSSINWKVIEEEKLEIPTESLIIFDWMGKFMSSGNSYSISYKGQKYFWFSHTKIRSELLHLRIGHNNTVKAKIKPLIEEGLVYKHPDCRRLQKSLYAISSKGQKVLKAFRFKTPECPTNDLSNDLASPTPTNVTGSNLQKIHEKLKNCLTQTCQVLGVNLNKEMSRHLDVIEQALDINLSAIIEEEIKTIDSSSKNTKNSHSINEKGECENLDLSIKETQEPEVIADRDNPATKLLVENIASYFHKKLTTNRLVGYARKVDIKLTELQLSLEEAQAHFEAYKKIRKKKKEGLFVTLSVASFDGYLKKGFEEDFIAQLEELCPRKESTVKTTDPIKTKKEELEINFNKFQADVFSIVGKEKFRQGYVDWELSSVEDKTIFFLLPNIEIYHFVESDHNLWKEAFKTWFNGYEIGFRIPEPVSKSKKDQEMDYADKSPNPKGLPTSFFKTLGLSSVQIGMLEQALPWGYEEVLKVIERLNLPSTVVKQLKTKYQHFPG